jgi:predicted nucleic acid-binding protein
MTTTAIDSNILIDIVSADLKYGPSSREAVENCAQEGSLIICAEVVAEFATGCSSATDSLAILQALTISYLDIGMQGAAEVGEVRSRKSKGGRMLADYMIAVHAATHADRLLTRDAEFTRMNVPGLVVVTPADILMKDS